MEAMARELRKVIHTQTQKIHNYITSYEEKNVKAFSDLQMALHLQNEFN